MKTKLISAFQLFSVSVFLCALLGLTSCASNPLSNPLVNTGVTLGTTTVLSQVITDPTTRTDVANYISVIAGALRAVTGTPTPAQLTALINSYVPASIKADVPEILAFVTPLIVAEYESLYAKYAGSGNGAQIAAGLNQIAADLEAGAAPYITH